MVMLAPGTKLPSQNFPVGVNLSAGPEIPTVENSRPPCIFKVLEMANEVHLESADEVARNGALLRINFGQRFS